MTKQKVIWCCQECGHNQTKWAGCCPACNRWNTLVEEFQQDTKERRFSHNEQKKSYPIAINDVKIGALQRVKSGIDEFDRLLGGGVAPGSLSLIGGNPGIGKSTLMLQISNSLAEQGLTVLYVCGEESIEQTSLRAKRIGAQSKNLLLLNETLFSHVKHSVEQLKPDILVIDSIQIMYKSELPSAPGSVSQVREIATDLMHIAKGQTISTFIIGHVTKTGEIAGPRVLEHIVDTVLDFEGDKQHGYRLLRSIKNRFGPTDHIALFQMHQEGLKEVSNPSEIFLQERSVESSGSVVIPTMEGNRPILIEVQALVTASAFSNSSRRSSGLDQNRLALLLAVLEKRVGYSLHSCDVFVSVAGGLKITEPAIDLGILLAIASSFCNKPIDEKTAVLGEVGLGGEIRSVPRLESRIKEASQMGFERLILPERCLKSLPKSLRGKIRLVGVEKVEEAIRELIS